MPGGEGKVVSSTSLCTAGHNHLISYRVPWGYRSGPRLSRNHRPLILKQPIQCHKLTTSLADRDTASQRCWPVESLSDRGYAVSRTRKPTGAPEESKLGRLRKDTGCR